ncbi:hypothetical protein LTR56_027038 [Elasticomyces elasticus]|nr:hypothetical protein LTR56_027038 [Elasticomyces elasticus]KAK3616352.1 hypothetical protein LTR22_027102 [Elasticomyces elasticus]KAK5734636.1 hypothetical protein LTS12_026655 [Elasticomyces elasticus]
MAATGPAEGVREHYPKPKHPLEHTIPLRKPSRVTIKHPGYRGSGNTLLTLPATDGADHSSAHYDTVHIACVVIAGNEFDGWLSASQSGDTRVEPDACGLVKAGIYYFHVSAGKTLLVTAGAISPQQPHLEYPIVPNFRCWRFPHTSLPRLWQQAGEGDESSERPQTCRLTLTSHGRALQKSHIIPSSEKSWFNENDMHQYGNLSGRGAQDVADMSGNLIRFRTDIHQLWDAT